MNKEQGKVFLHSVRALLRSQTAGPRIPQKQKAISPEDHVSSKNKLRVDHKYVRIQLQSSWLLIDSHQDDLNYAFNFNCWWITCDFSVGVRRWDDS